MKETTTGTPLQEKEPGEQSSQFSPDFPDASVAHALPEQTKLLTRNYIRQAFDTVLKSFHPGEHRKGRQPFRMQQLIERLLASEDVSIDLDVLAEDFADMPNPKSYAQSSISKLNAALVESGYDLEITRTVTYRVRPRKKNS